MTTLMKSAISGERFIVVGENCSYKILFDYIATLLETKSPSINASKTFTAIAWRIDWLWSTITNSKRKLTKATAASSHANDYFSTEKIESVLKVTFQKKETFLKEVI